MFPADEYVKILPRSLYQRVPMSDLQFSLYTDGACSGNPGPGGYAAILVATDDADNVQKNEKLLVLRPRPPTIAWRSWQLLKGCGR